MTLSFDVVVIGAGHAGCEAAAAAAVYVVLQKVKAKNAPESYDEDNYVSCSCLEDDFISETVAE